ncbi:PDZ domain-containing protein [archaeon]|nr:PDZ domain-containing protein [archaeon]
MQWKEFLKPTIVKVSLSFLIAGLCRLTYYLLSITRDPNAIVLTIKPALPIMILDFLFFVLLMYPLACSLCHLWPQYKKGNLLLALKEKKVLFCIIFFNPYVLKIVFFIFYFLFINLYISQLPNTECGVLLVGVFPDSPAEKAGLHSGITILSVNGETIETLSEFSNVIKSKKPGDEIIISSYSDGLTTNYGSNITIILGKNPSENIDYGFFGANVTQNFVKSTTMCKK